MPSRLLSDVLFLVSSIILSRSGKKYPYLVLRPRRKAMRLLTLGMILSYKPFYDDFYDGIFFGFVLCRSCACFSEFMCAIALSCPANTVSLQTYVLSLNRITFLNYNFSLLFLDYPSDLDG